MDFKNGFERLKTLEKWPCLILRVTRRRWLEKCAIIKVLPDSDIIVAPFYVWWATKMCLSSAKLTSQCVLQDGGWWRHNWLETVEVHSDKGLFAWEVEGEEEEKRNVGEGEMAYSNWRREMIFKKKKILSLHIGLRLNLNLKRKNF